LYHHSGIAAKGIPLLRKIEFKTLKENQITIMPMQDWSKCTPNYCAKRTAGTSLCDNGKCILDPDHPYEPDTNSTALNCKICGQSKWNHRR